jgi:hypothetical protein
LPFWLGNCSSDADCPKNGLHCDTQVGRCARM